MKVFVDFENCRGTFASNGTLSLDTTVSETDRATGQMNSEIWGGGLVASDMTLRPGISRSGGAPVGRQKLHNSPRGRTAVSVLGMI